MSLLDSNLEEQIKPSFQTLEKTPHVRFEERAPVVNSLRTGNAPKITQEKRKILKRITPST